MTTTGTLDRQSHRAHRPEVWCDQVLTSAQLETFASEGFLLLPSFFDEALVSAATAAVQRLAPATRTPGPRFTFPQLACVPELAALERAASKAVSSVVGAVEPSLSCQIAQTFPPFPRGAGRPHIDGTAAEPGGRPATFTLLSGYVLSDQRGPDGGGLWVWPGSHLEHASYFEEHGPEAFWAGDPGYPDVTRATPVQLEPAAGALLLLHYLLGHCPGGVLGRARTTVYVRITSAAHAGRWREAMTDPLADLDGLRFGGPAQRLRSFPSVSAGGE